MALVSGFAFEVGCFEGYVADFEDADGYGVVFVFAEGFEEAGEEGGADDLVFCCFGVGEDDGCFLVVDAV